MATQTATVVTFNCFQGDFFAIQLADGSHFKATQYGQTNIALFDTAEAAQDFIDGGEHIAVETLNMAAFLQAAGWVEAEGYSAANAARLQAYCAAEGIHYYSADREDFSRYTAIRQAQRLGLTKVVMEDLS
jgi:hypothetical protein